MSDAEARSDVDYRPAPLAPVEPPTPLPADQLRWRCDPDAFGFETTDEIEPETGIVGQDTALAALRFGLETMAPGQNIFISGLTGPGRVRLIERLLDTMKPACPLAKDRVYVHNFDDPPQPTLITVPRGRGLAFEHTMQRFIEFIEHDLVAALQSEAFEARMGALQQQTQAEIDAVTKPFADELTTTGLALVTATSGQSARPAIFPTINGEPVPPEVFEQAHKKGDVSDEDYQGKLDAIQAATPKLHALAEQAQQIINSHGEIAEALFAKEVEEIVRPRLNTIRYQFDQPDVHAFLDAVQNDLIENRLDELDENMPFTVLYTVNVVSPHGRQDGCPVIVERTPTVTNLLGGVELRPGTEDKPQPPHVMIRAGSMLRADGGYLVMEARDVLSEPAAWRALMRTVRAGKIEFAPPEAAPGMVRPVHIKPEPINVSVKVVLIGEAGMFYVLDAADPDFSELFKVLAEFDSVVPRNDASLKHYAGVLRRIQADDNLPPFRADAVAALAEHGARIASKAESLSSRFSRLADIAREAGFVASKANRKIVEGDDIRETVRRTRMRANLRSRKFRELMAQGVIQVATRGGAVGQINGLAVMSAGPLTYGFPARITATLGPGAAGLINIEGESELSGAIHTKGFHILSGLLRTLLKTDHPLTFDASIAFEQSYGGIDGDSASGAETCVLLSAMTGIPVRQDLAITGAIDQVGAFLAIGGVNEKIEGFFDACVDQGLTGTQGVIIPASNAGELMLRHDVVEAASQGNFHVYAARSIREAITLMLHTPAGVPGHDDPTTVIGQARAQAKIMWDASAAVRR